jgi:hypothetical protein
MGRSFHAFSIFLCFALSAAPGRCAPSLLGVGANQPAGEHVTSSPAPAAPEAAPAPDPDLSVRLADAKPEPFGGFVVPCAPPDADALRTLSTGSMRRAGAASDGVSLLVVQLRTRSPARLRVELVGDEPGALGMVTDTHIWKATATSLVLDTAPDGKGHAAVALYRPPDEFGKRFADRSERTVELHVRDERTRVPLRQRAHVQPIRIVRPPVVLVHGTYSDLVEDFQTPLKRGLRTMERTMVDAGFTVSMVDYKQTNGRSSGGDSAFTDNQKVVFEGPGGIRDALQRFRDARLREPIAVTQADVVGYSMGGVLVRVYARGSSLKGPAPSFDHFHAGRSRCPDCWYHRADNFHQGDIHRLITLGSTHMGSDICRVFEGYQDAIDDITAHDPHAMMTADAAWPAMLLIFADWDMGIHTGAHQNQNPGSDELRDLGPTPVPSHAVVGHSDDADTVTNYGGYYANRMSKIWQLSSPAVLQLAFWHMGQERDGVKLARMRKLQSDLEGTDNHGLSPDEAALQLAHLRKEGPISLRRAAFGNTPNDCTVRLESAMGGLFPPHVTEFDHVVHSELPHDPRVIARVIELLARPGDAFSPSFPDSWIARQLNPVRAKNWKRASVSSSGNP